MSSSESIKCDACGAELIVDTMYPAVYSLELRNIDTWTTEAEKAGEVSQ